MHDGNDGLVKSSNDHAAQVHEAFYMPASDRVDISRVCGIVSRRWSVILLSLSAVLALGLPYTFTRTPIYEASTLLMVSSPQVVSSGSNDVALMDDLAAFTKNRSVESQIALVSVPEVRNQAAARLGKANIQKGFRSDVIPDWAVGVASKKGSDVISVTARSYDPKVSAGLSEAVCSCYVDNDLKRSSAAIRQAREHVASGLRNVQDQLTKARADLAEFKRAHRLIAADDQFRTIAGNELALEMERDRAAVQLASARSEKAALESQLKAQGREILESSTSQMSPLYQEAMQEIGRLYSRRASLLQEYTPDSKDVKQIEATIAEVEMQMKRNADKVISAKVHARNPLLSTYASTTISNAASQARVRALDQAISESNRRVDKLPQQQRAVTALAQREAVLERAYDTLSDKYYALMVNEKSAIPNAHIVSSPQIPQHPVFPSRAQNSILVLMIGLMVACAAAALAEKHDRRVRSEAVVTELTGEPPLASIPYTSQLLTQTHGAISDPDKVGFNEAVKMLRNAILCAGASRSTRLLAITSPGRGEGKSTTAISLAKSVALAGKRVLIVDYDFRCPTIHKRLGLAGETGLSNVLKGLAPLEEAICITDFAGLCCLPAGPYYPDISEALHSESSRAVFRQMAQRFDSVIVDCSPCSGLSDVQMVSGVVDGVLLVIAIDESTPQGICDAILNLQRVDAPIIGYVLNRVRVSQRNGYYYGDNWKPGYPAKPDTGEPAPELSAVSTMNNRHEQ